MTATRKTHHVSSGVVDPGRASPARVYDCWLGGKDHVAADRSVAEQVRRGAPWIVGAARANRAFLVRAVEFLVRAGVDQFLDIGTGLPTARNVHEVAQDIDPGARVVYVDDDPVVVAHARALLARQDGVGAVHGDARDPARILEQAYGVGGLDLSRPVGLLFVAVLHFLSDRDDPAGVLETFAEVLPSGSFLGLSHLTPVTRTGAQGLRSGSALRACVRRCGPTNRTPSRSSRGPDPRSPGCPPPGT
jgi:hypothetical protein